MRKTYILLISLPADSTTVLLIANIMKIINPSNRDYRCFSGKLSRIYQIESCRFIIVDYYDGKFKVKINNHVPLIC